MINFSIRWSLWATDCVSRKLPRLRLNSGRQPMTATWPGSSTKVVASSRMVSSCWPLLIRNSWGPSGVALGIAWKCAGSGRGGFRGPSAAKRCLAHRAGGHAKIAAGVRGSPCRDPIVAVQKQAGQLDRCADGDQGRVATDHEEFAGIDLFLRRRVLEDRLELEGKFADNPSDPQAIDFPGSSLRGGNHLLVSHAPHHFVDRRVAEWTSQNRDLQQAAFGLDELAAVAADAANTFPGRFPFLSSAQPATISSPPRPTRVAS